MVLMAGIAVCAISTMMTIPAAGGECTEATCSPAIIAALAEVDPE
jgi:hypothetical protein